MDTTNFEVIEKKKEWEETNAAIALMDMSRPMCDLYTSTIPKYGAKKIGLAHTVEQRVGSLPTRNMTYDGGHMFGTDHIIPAFGKGGEHDLSMDGDGTPFGLRLANPAPSLIFYENGLKPYYFEVATEVKDEKDEKDEKGYEDVSIAVSCSGVVCTDVQLVFPRDLSQMVQKYEVERSGLLITLLVVRVGIVPTAGQRHRERGREYEMEFTWSSGAIVRTGSFFLRSKVTALSIMDFVKSQLSPAEFRFYPGYNVFIREVERNFGRLKVYLKNGENKGRKMRGPGTPVKFRGSKSRFSNWRRTGDAGLDAGLDAELDTGLDAELDTGLDAGLDAVTEGKEQELIETMDC
jgi:hypothetical protein